MLPVQNVDLTVKQVKAEGFPLKCLKYMCGIHEKRKNKDDGPVCIL